MAAYDIVELFSDQKIKNKYLNIAAPMVRYSKLEFRTLVRENNVKLCFTPMIIADSFIRSKEARLNEFTTNKCDSPLIAQFAAKTASEMLTASELIYPYVNGVDLNCGCPQSWAISKGYGCALLRNPDFILDIVKTLRRNLPSKFSCSVKLRLLQEDFRSTVELCRQLEKCGITFIIIHGRTQWQKTSYPLDVSAMAEIKKSIQIPLVVNGNVRTLQDAEELHRHTQADGIMAARGLLANPALFTGTKQTTLECVQQWLNIAHAARDNISFQCFHHHLTFMWGKVMQRRHRMQFNSFSRKGQIYNFFEEIHHIRPKEIKNWTPNIECKYNDHVVKKHIPTTLLDLNKDVWNYTSNGKFYNNFNENVYDDTDLFFQNGSIFDL